MAQAPVKVGKSYTFWRWDLFTGGYYSVVEGQHFTGFSNYKLLSDTQYSYGLTVVYGDVDWGGFLDFHTYQANYKPDGASPFTLLDLTVDRVKLSLGPSLKVADFEQSSLYAMLGLGFKDTVSVENIGTTFRIDKDRLNGVSLALFLPYTFSGFTVSGDSRFISASKTSLELRALYQYYANSQIRDTMYGGEVGYFKHFQFVRLGLTAEYSIGQLAAPEYKYTYKNLIVSLRLGGSFK